MSDSHPHRRLSNVGETFAGAIAGAMSRCLVSPLDVIKIRMQLDRGLEAETPGAKVGMVRTIRTLLAEEGIVSLWRGNVPALMLWICYGAVQFPVYGAFTRGLTAAWVPDLHDGRRAKPPGVVLLLSGAVSASAATCVTYPLDWARTRMATQGVPRKHKTTFSLIRHTLVKEVGVVFT